MVGRHRTDDPSTTAPVTPISHRRSRVNDLIVPAALLAGALILRRRKLGYVVAFSLLVVEASLLPMIVLATIRQVQLDVTFETAEIVGPIGGFGIFAVGAVWVLASLLRHVARADPGAQPS